MVDTGVDRGGRPVVINEERVTVAEQIIDSPGVVVAWTDADIVEETNYRLKIQNKGNYMISLRSYERYKALMLKNSLEDLAELNVADMIVIEKFWRLIKAKLRQEKLGLLAKLAIDPKRQRWARVFERKFTKERAIPGPWTKHAGEDEAKEEDTAINEVEVTIMVPEHA